MDKYFCEFEYYPTNDIRNNIVSGYRKCTFVFKDPAILAKHFDWLKRHTDSLVTKITNDVELLSGDEWKMNEEFKSIDPNKKGKVCDQYLRLIRNQLTSLNNFEKEKENILGYILSGLEIKYITYLKSWYDILYFIKEFGSEMNEEYRHKVLLPFLQKLQKSGVVFINADDGVEYDFIGNSDFDGDEMEYKMTVEQK
ncbi:MAG: hypothetical protein IJ772_05475 [Bacilli bacterium]|nr:hypothetical protein [Bacilli bacterium]